MPEDVPAKKVEPDVPIGRSEAVRADRTHALEALRFTADRWLVLILLVSLALRVWLLSSISTPFWPDEGRYHSSEFAANSLLNGNLSRASDYLFAGADHLGYKLAMVLPAMWRAMWHWNYPVMPFLGATLFSVGNIAWIYAIARRAGAEIPEARWAAFFAAASSALFYWSRHLVPYDMSLFLGLACLWVGMHPAARWWHSLVAGALGFLAFVTYNGYWMFVAFALVVHVLLGWPSWRKLLPRALFGLGGLVGPFCAMLWWTTSLGFNLIGSYITFSESIAQGDFSDGHRIVAAYLWFTEGGLLILWLAAMALLLALVVGRREKIPGRAWLWFAGIVSFALGFVLFSNVLEKFVVYGRLVRQLVPFFALLAGWAAMRVAGAPLQAGRRWALAALVVVIAGWNFRIPLTQEFDFATSAMAFADRYVQRMKSEGRPAPPREKFVLLNVGHLWPMPQKPPQSPYEVLLVGRQPLQFRPFLYEGFNREQRRIFLASDIRPKLILMKD